MNSDATAQGRRGWPGAALVLAAHGSSKNADSSRPTRAIAGELRRRGLFGEVAVAFWKEAPPLREALASLCFPVVYIVPNFIGEGYFTRKVLPREFGLDGPVTIRGGRRICYCKPTGSHASMTSLLVRRATEALGAAAAASEACLLLVGHGTGRDDRSAAAVLRQVEAIGALGLFAEVRAAFLEQEPAVGRWRELTLRRDVVVVPFFISDGPHTLEDVPEALGMRGVGDPPLAAPTLARGPQDLAGRRLWYTPAIGGDPCMPDAIIDIIRDFDTAHPTAPGGPGAVQADGWPDVGRCVDSPEWL